MSSSEQSVASGPGSLDPSLQSVPRLVARMPAPIVRAYREARLLFRIADSLRDRISIAKYIILLYAARLLPLDLNGRNVKVRLRGTSYSVGLRTSEIYVFFEIFTASMYDEIESYISEPGWVVLDLGANIGVFSVVQAQRDARVYAFEPNVEAFGRFLRTIEDNSLDDRITPFQIAIGASGGTGVLHVDEGGTTGGTVVAGDRHDNGGAEVQIASLDELLPELGIDHVDLLKMDIEGFEVEAMRGATDTLDKTDRIIAEYHSRALLDEYEVILEQHGLKRDLIFVYYPAEKSGTGEEVGMVYSSRH